MANFNPKQYRDSRGRFARKPSLFNRVFRTFHTFRDSAPATDAKTPPPKPRDTRRGTPHQPQGGELAEIRATVKQMRRLLDKLEALTDGNGRGDYLQAVVERPRVIISGKAPELRAFLELLGAAGL